MRVLLFFVGIGMVLYLISSLTGGGKIGLIWTLSLAGGYLPLGYTNLQIYGTLYWFYVLITVVVLMFAIFTTPSGKKKNKKK